jgi:hypothetical protein
MYKMPLLQVPSISHLMQAVLTLLAKYSSVICKMLLLQVDSISHHVQAVIIVLFTQNILT